MSQNHKPKFFRCSKASSSIVKRTTLPDLEVPRNTIGVTTQNPLVGIPNKENGQKRISQIMDPDPINRKNMIRKMDPSSKVGTMFELRLSDILRFGKGKNICEFLFELPPPATASNSEKALIGRRLYRTVKTGLFEFN